MACLVLSLLAFLSKRKDRVQSCKDNTTYDLLILQPVVLGRVFTLGKSYEKADSTNVKHPAMHACLTAVANTTRQSFQTPKLMDSKWANLTV